jgi:hypothetical protein
MFAHVASYLPALPRFPLFSLQDILQQIHLLASVTERTQPHSVEFVIN